VVRSLQRFASTLLSGTSSRHSTPDDQSQHFRVLAETSGDIICRIGHDLMPLYVSPSVEPALGRTPEEMIRAGPAFIHPDDRALVAAVHDRLLSGEKDSAKVSFRLLKRDGRPVWVEANASVARDANGQPGDIVIVMRDISERKRLEDELRALSLTDGLTGLANRRAFDDILEREWQRTVRVGSEMSLLLLDIDHFKQFNDQFGHQAGDDCLRVVAAAVKAALRRPGDMAARYGGEEIAIVLPDTKTEAALAVAESIRVRVEALNVHHGGNSHAAHTMTVSIGVATAFGREGATTKMPHGLLLAADGALYKAKQNGRNRVEPAVLLAAPGDCGSSGAS